MTLWSGLAAILLILMPSASMAEYLISNQAAARLGLERAWFAQVRVDPARDKVVHWLHDGDQIFALTSAGTIQAIHSETGATLWTTELGVGHAPAAGIAVNEKHVALLGASRLYIMDRTDGHHLWSRKVGGPAGAAPALSKKYAYVALLSGRIEAYRLSEPTAYAWQYESIGRVYQSPSTTGPVVSWPTDRGFLYVGRADPPKVFFRVKLNDEIVTAPAERSPHLYVGSLDGYLYCFNEITGGEQWRYSTGFSITSKPAIVGNKAYVASEGPMLHAVNALTGKGLWQVSGVSHFVALGKQHTYCMDRYGTLVVLDNESGGVAGRLPTDEGNSAIVNDKSDRIFLINDRGLVQCLHEIGATTPTWHRATDNKDSEAAKEAPGETDAQELEADTDGLDAEEDSPFKNEPEETEADAFDDVNPFD